MKIKDLKPEYKELAIANQIAQGNKPNEELPLDEYHYLGGFKWSRSPEGFDFWEAVNNGESTEIPQPEKLRENEIISQSDIDKEADEYRASVNDTLVRPDIAFKAGVEWAQGRLSAKNKIQSLQKENAQLQKSWDDLAELNGSKILEISELQKENKILILEKELLEIENKLSPYLTTEARNLYKKQIALKEAKLKELKGE